MRHSIPAHLPVPRRRPDRPRRAQRGQAIVEAAGGLTVLLLLTIGIVDFAPAVVRTGQLTQAVRDGAAYARTAPAATFEIRRRVANAAPAVFGVPTDAQVADMTNDQIAVTCAAGLDGAAKSCASAGVGDSVTVTATYRFETVTGLFSALLQAPVEISRSATSEIF